MAIQSCSCSSIRTHPSTFASGIVLAIIAIAASLFCVGGLLANTDLLPAGLTSFYDSVTLSNAAFCCILGGSLSTLFLGVALAVKTMRKKKEQTPAPPIPTPLLSPRKNPPLHEAFEGAFTLSPGDSHPAAIQARKIHRLDGKKWWENEGEGIAPFPHTLPNRDLPNPFYLPLSLFWDDNLNFVQKIRFTYAGKLIEFPVDDAVIAQIKIYVSQAGERTSLLPDTPKPSLTPKAKILATRTNIQLKLGQEHQALLAKKLQVEKPQIRKYNERGDEEDCSVLPTLLKTVYEPEYEKSHVTGPAYKGQRMLNLNLYECTDFYMVFFSDMLFIYAHGSSSEGFLYKIEGFKEQDLERFIPFHGGASLISKKHS